jgi:tRNA pseudouridine55 synthase
MRCTKGTYVRTLCADIGRELGCGAFLESLRRTASGAFAAADARPLDTLLNGSREDLAAGLLPLAVLIPPS